MNVVSVFSVVHVLTPLLQVVHSDVQRGIIVTKKIETKLLVSVLSIRSARLLDAGQYACLSSDHESASINVHVLKGTSSLPRASIS